MNLSSVPLPYNGGERRVRTLKLSAPEEGLVRRGAAVLEDALRTASLPWADGGRLVFVRRLDLGSIRPGLGPAGVARLLEERLRQVGAEAVHAEHPAAGDRSAVYFRDAAEPAVCLARRLARGRAAEAWFWPLAVPAWQPIRAPSEGLRRLLHGVVQAPMGPAVAPVLARALLETGDLDPMLAALEPDDGPALLRASAWQAPAAHRRQGDGRGSSAGEAPWLEAAAPLATWSRRWGAGDARSLWLAATLLVAEKPARRLDPCLTARARALLDRFVSERVAQDPVAPSRFAPERVASDQATSGQAMGGRSAAGAEDLAAPDSRVAERIAEDAPAGDPLPQAGFPSMVEAPPAAEPAPVARPQRRGVASKTVDEAARPPGARTVPEETTETTDGSARPGPVASEEPSPDVDRHDCPVAVRSAAASRRSSGGPEPATPPILPEELLPSAHAGLFLLLPALERLGITAFFAGHPHLVERDLPSRLLHHFGLRLGIPEDDPVRLALPVALSRAARRRPGVLPRPGLTPRLLLDSWLIATRLWCRRYADVGLGDLVHRPGWVTATPTHVDVFFDLRQVDVRVRRAGLDFDPGWLPWLGRVVLFHYLEGPEEDGR